MRAREIKKIKKEKFLNKKYSDFENFRNDKTTTIDT